VSKLNFVTYCQMKLSFQQMSFLNYLLLKKFPYIITNKKIFLITECCRNIHRPDRRDGVNILTSECYRNIHRQDRRDGVNILTSECYRNIHRQDRRDGVNILTSECYRNIHRQDRRDGVNIYFVYLLKIYVLYNKIKAF
jgi:hypothetical protein